MTTNEDFLAHLRPLREHLGLSATEVAGRLGVRPSTYLRWENRDDVPNAENFVELRALLDPDGKPVPRIKRVK
jgi:transcriptional regulator with XRE-family HTH domain